MVKYRQPIWPGDIGRDITAVKRAVVAMRAPGYSSLVVDRTAGPTFVRVLNKILTSHNQKADGKYGPIAHSIIAPHFDRYGAWLYSRAAIRKRSKPVTILTLSAQEAAQELISLSAKGMYRADNPGDMRDLVATSQGRAVWSQHGMWLHLDARPLRLLVSLIKQHSYEIGTFALCSDHHDDGPHGHSGGLAVDISSINGAPIAAYGDGIHDLTLAVAKVIHNDTHLRPRQLICGGSGYIFYSDIEAQTIPSASFYGWETMSEHRNHIHCGY
jgi:hypothetical protein